MKKRKRNRDMDIIIDNKSVNQFWGEIMQHIKTHGILTISCMTTGESQAWDIDSKGHLGTSIAQTAILHARFARFLGENKALGIILRTFTDKIHENGLPIKELRGYVVFLHNNIVQWRKIPKDELSVLCSTDHKTGEPIPPEAAVEYCDDE